MQPLGKKRRRREREERRRLGQRSSSFFIMTSIRKMRQLRNVKEIFDSNKFIFVAHMNGLSVRDENNLKVALKGWGINMINPKNSLAR